MKRFPDIFNDALAPVTPGPSSSNTCGPARIGRTVRRLLGEKAVYAKIRMSNAGNYKMSFRGMRTDLAFLTGFLDRDVTDPRFLHAVRDAAAEGLVMETEFTDDLPGFPTALAVITLRGESGRELTARTVSAGGGAFRIEEVEGIPVMITGDCYETLLFLPPAQTEDGRVETQGLQDEEEISEKLRKMIPGFLEAVCSSNGSRSLVEIRSSRPVGTGTMEMILRLAGASGSAACAPIYPIVTGAGTEPPFSDSAGFIQYCEKTGLAPWEAALGYESAVSGWTKEAVFSYAVDLWHIAMESVEGGFREGNDMNGIAHAMAPQVKERFHDGTLLPLGAIDTAAPAALSIMEYSNCSGVVICIPTGGSSGVVPGALLGAAKALHADETECVKALLTAGLIGAFMEKTHYLGSYGCQMEIGLAAGMAAGGLVHFLKGTASQTCSAAVMALQSMTGLLCDKIAGLVQVPCLSRNMTASAIAMVCANAAMAGVETLIPLEQKLDSMMVIGKKLIDEGINRMGDMGTPAGKRLAEEQKERDRKLREAL